MALHLLKSLLVSCTIFSNTGEIVTDQPQQQNRSEKDNKPSQNTNPPSSAWSNKQNTEVSNPPAADPPRPSSDHALFWASFLYWQAKQDFMDVAYRGHHYEPNFAFGNSHNQGRVIEQQAGYEPGFKVGAKYYLPSSNWNIAAEYTFFNSTSKVSRHRPSGGFLFSKWIQPILIVNNSSNRVKATWKLDMDTLNLEVGRAVFIGSKLRLTPYCGIGNAWINQKNKAHMQLRLPTMSLHTHQKSDAYEIGPRIGVAASLDVWSYFSIEANLATELLFSYYRVSLRQKAPHHPSVYLYSSNHFTRVNPEIELYLGASHQSSFYNERMYLRAELGWDFQYWWNQNMMRWYNDITYISTPVGNLSLQGLRATLGFGF